MRMVNVASLLLVIIGAINWGLVGLFEFNLVSALFGEQSALSRLIYVLVGVSGVVQILPWMRSLSGNEVAVQQR